METELTPIKAIRAHCVECSGSVFKCALWCPVTNCALWQYRLGSRPSTVAAKHCPELVDPEAQPGSQIDVDSLPKGIPGAVEWFKRRRMSTRGAPGADAA